MNARKLVLAVLISVCASVCVLTLGARVAGAASQIGSVGHAGGQLENPGALGVDGSGDLYVDEDCPYLFADVNCRVDKFDASGSFLLAWGEGVAGGTARRETCITFCQAGSNPSGFPSGPLAVDDDPLSSSYGDVYVMAGGATEKFGPSGEFLMSLPFSGSAIAVGPGGLIYVGGKAQVQVFEQSGALKETISLAGLSSTGNASRLAVDSAGDVFVVASGVAGVHELEPGGTEKGFDFDASSTSVDGLALDGSGHLFVSDSSGGFHVLEFDAATGEEVASFAQNAVGGVIGDLAFSQTTGDLYVSESIHETFGVNSASVRVFSPPPPGPLVEGEVATPEQGGAATVEAVIDPEGAETTYSVEYVGETQFQAGGFAGAASTTPVSIPADFEGHGVVAHLTGLTLGAAYHWRVVTHNSNGTTTGADNTFEETSAALVSGPWAADVASTSATLSAQIDPLGTSTEYRFEYGRSPSYGQVVSGSVGEGTSSVPVSRHVQELSPGTVYHYRVVTHSTVGTVEGADHLFTTQPVGGESSLPDGRAWELVSPPNKGGGVIGPFQGGEGIMQAASDGSAITYVAIGVFGEGAAGRRVYSQTLSSRGAGGWGSRALSILAHIPTEEKAGSLFYLRPEFVSFSPDLSLAVVAPPFDAATPLSPVATGRTVYVHNTVTGSFVPIVYPGDVPPATQFYRPGSNEDNETMVFDGATPDVSHVLLSTAFALTPEAIGVGAAGYEGGRNIYEWGAGRLQLVNILPNDQPTGGAVQLGRNAPFRSGAPAVSSDGRWIVWRDIENALYVRDMVGQRTVRVGSAYSHFEGISSDGSRVFFEDGGNLYAFDTASDTYVDLTASRRAGETNAGVQLYGPLDGVRVSEDGSYVYFVATGVLADGGVSGADNVYVSHDAGGVWSTGYVGTLSSEDEQLNYSRVSPNGRFLAFMSNRSLTGYDNLDVNSGQSDEEVFLYDAGAGRLVCASCNPTGARPIGVLDAGSTPLFDTNQEWNHAAWVAGSLPDYEYAVGDVLTSSQPRSVSDSGRLFFNSSDALVAHDTNGLMDVYEYEPVGVGGCASGDGLFSERSDGCVDVISSGTSSGESVFLDASMSGDDAFFVTSSRLTAADYDTTYDVYDAHVCSASVPCVAAPVVPPPCTTADSCKAALSPQPEIFGPAPSATFSGIGNVVEEAKKPGVKRKVKPKHHKKKRKRKGRKAKRSRAGRARRSSAGEASVRGGRRSS